MPKVTVHRSIEEIIIFSVSVLVICTVLPFAIYRLLQGQLAVGLIELFGVAVVSIIGAIVWKTRNTKITGFVLSAFMLGGTIGVNYLIGPSILFWLFPIVITVCFLNNTKIAAALLIPSIFALLPLLINERNIVEVVSIMLTLFITQIFGHIVSYKIKEQHERLQSLANRDGLTGAMNRRSLDDRLDILQNLYFRHRRKNGNMSSVILFDIDNFKAINDNYGHLEGDQILIRLTETIKKYIRRTDELYRYGGEEFVLLVNGASLIKAAELAEKIRVLIENTKLSSKTKVTASFGVAEVQRHESSSKWLARADDALYRAKRAGKNRVFLANANKIEDTPSNSKKIVKI